MAAGTPLLELRDVQAGYGGPPVLDGLSLSVPSGAFTALIGPNGGGKSTLLRTACRVLRPWRGQALLSGRDLWSMSQAEVARLVGFVAQGAETDFEFTVEDVVLMGRYPHLAGLARPGREDLALAEAAMRATGVLELRDRTVAELSGGEAQRAVIARCLAQQPRLLLLDEPTSHLDLLYQAEIMDLLRRLNREEDLSILAVLHDLNLAAQFFREFVLLAGGRIVAAGGPGEVLTPELLGQAYRAEIRVSTDGEGRVTGVRAEPRRA